MSKNTLIRNGQEIEVSDAEMRDFYESFLDGSMSVAVNARKNLKEKTRELIALKKENEQLKARLEEIENVNKILRNE
jgi:polyhydroxyalkanoate synthesis regulator protein